MEFTATTLTELENAITAITTDSQIVSGIIHIPNIIDLTGRVGVFDINKRIDFKGTSVDTSGILFPINTQFFVTANDCEFDDILFEGPHSGTTIPSGDPTTGAINISGVTGIKINNCEIKYFSSYAIRCLDSRDNIVSNSYLHHNRRDGLGYGVVLEGNSFITAFDNHMEYNRHCIAGTGAVGQGYHAYNNIFGISGMPNSGNTDASSRLDMHGDGLNDIAGEYIEIHDNFFTSDIGIDIGIRGFPTKACKIYNNYFTHSNQRDAITQVNVDIVQGNLKMTRMQINNNSYNRTNCTEIGISQNFLVQNDKGEAHQYLFNSNCYFNLLRKKIGSFFSIVTEIWPNNWTGLDNNDDIIVKTKINTFLLFKNENGTFLNNSITIDNEELNKYHLLKVGNVTSTTRKFIGQKDDDNLYEITINSGGTITEDLLVTTTTPFKDIIVAKINDLSLESIVGYSDNGDTVAFFNDGVGGLGTGTTLGTFSGHTFYDKGNLIDNNYDQLVSHDGLYIYLWRWNNGTFLNGAPTIRSGNNGDIYNDLISIEYLGKPHLLTVNKNGDIQVLEYDSSFKNPIDIGSVVGNKIYKLNF